MSNTFKTIVRNGCTITRQEVSRTYAQNGHKGTPTYVYTVRRDGRIVGSDALLRGAKEIADMSTMTDAEQDAFLDARKPRGVVLTKRP